MSIATNRAERQQMRQRGAANRKVKEVDFGFSFGSPQLPTNQPAQASPPSAASSQPVPAALPRVLTPNKKLSRPSTPLSRRRSTKQTGDTPSRSVPGNVSRTLISSPRSVYDIPLDVETEERSPKRRRISHFETIDEDGPLNSHDPQSNLPAVETVTETIETTVFDQKEQVTLPTALPEPIQPANGTISPLDESPGIASVQWGTPTSAELPQENTPTEENNQQEEYRDFEEQRPTRNSQRKKRKAKSKLFSKKKKPPSQPRAEPENEGLDRVASSKEKSTGVQKNARESIERRSLSSNADAESALGAKSPSLPQEEKENEPRKSPVPEDEHERSETSNLVAVEENSHISTEEKWQQSPSPDLSKQSRKLGRNKRRRPQRADETQAEDHGPVQPDGEQPETVQPETVQPEQSEITQASEPQRKRKRRKQASSRDGEVDADGRGISTTKTIPVTIHRLANVAALEAAPFDDQDLSDQDHPAPQKSSHKYLNRSGINAADVLSQICNESLDKTISTLQTNIEQEQNASRRNEWKRKCKVVQDFGMELENSLFDTSELLESNFTLAARLKAEKRELHQLRHRLLSLRKEREELALRMDEVRRKHVDNESEKMKHESLNNSLHDLQLAVDRSQKRKNATEASPFAGLEFLLRTVAQDVSSTAPDSRGGLLNQVKQFNSQLEKASALLEEKR